MELRDLAHSGLVSSKVILGTMTFGSQVDQAGARAMVDAAIEAGVNHFDTANSYNGGLAEEMLAEALGPRREDVIVATKVCNRFADGPDGAGLHRAGILAAIDGSLRRLRTDYVDLYYLHRPDRSAPIEETLDTMADLVKAGKVRHVGFSNYSAWQVADMLNWSRTHGRSEARIGQQLYNPLSRALDEDYAELAATHDLATVVYNPLAGGLLTGKHRGHAEPSAGRFQDNPVYRDRYWRPSLMAAVDSLAEIAASAGSTLLELTFSWLCSRPLVDGVIVGASNLDQLRANLNAAGHGAPSDEVTQQMDALWGELRGPFPRYSR